ncbi:MAG TPA: TylF/MycF/NovP-related O-methyltransferase [Polyangiaceae bacterium]|nr:TylF/MycF/NovP-related O-methyltransferase [Polyangiaceae bacterium]
MKRQIRNLLATAGYKIERTRNPNPLEGKYQRALREVYGCYRDLKFQSLPEPDARTIELMARLDGTQASEAVYLLNALHAIQSLDGDVCEFGVAQGYTSALIGHTILPTKKTFWLFDSFEGLPAPTTKDKLKDDVLNLKSMEAYQGTMAYAQQVLLGSLKGVNFPLIRTKIIDGFIEKTILSATMPSKVSFAYVDFDFYEPIKIALDFLHKVLAKGGIVIVDDYDYFSEGAKIAVDEFVAEHPADYAFEVPIPSAGKFALLTRRT